MENCVLRHKLLNGSSSRTLKTLRSSNAQNNNLTYLFSVRSQILNHELIFEGLIESKDGPRSNLSNDLAYDVSASEPNHVLNGRVGTRFRRG